MVRGGWGGVCVLLVSPHLAGCGEYGDTKFLHGVNPRYTFRRESLTISVSGLALGAMAQEGKGESLVPPWPWVIEPVGGRIFFRGGHLQSKVIYSRPELRVRIFPFFFHYRPMGAGVGRGRVPIVLPHAGDIELVGGTLFFPGRHHHSKVIDGLMQETVSWSRGSIQPSLRVNQIQGRTELRSE
jgi:hypothetical protein